MGERIEATYSGAAESTREPMVKGVLMLSGGRREDELKYQPVEGFSALLARCFAMLPWRS
jgi:hypothetical protein